jgi:two-component system, OmpR family, sensor kinase
MKTNHQHMPTLPPLASTHRPGTHHIHLTPDRLRVTWVAALFGLLLGITMTYVPYEFQTAAFQQIYPHIRLIGFWFLVGSVATLLAKLYPRRLRWLDVLGRVCLIATISVYWWTVAVVPISRTGIVLYPIMVLCLALEGLPRWRGRGLFPFFVSLVSIAFGLIMLFLPGQFGVVTYSHLQPVIFQVGIFYLVGGVGLWIAPWRNDARWRVVLFGGLTLPFLYLAYALGRAGAWAGMELYLVITLGCALATVSPWVNPPASVRWRLLRGFIVAGLVPLLVLGGLASYLAQRAIEEQTRENATLIMTTEAERMAQLVAATRGALQAQANTPSFADAIARQDRASLEAQLDTLSKYQPLFHTLGVLDDQGGALTSVGAARGSQGNFADRDFFQQAIEAREGYVSRPFLNVTQQPLIVIAVPVQSGGRAIGILAGSMVIDELMGLAPLSSLPHQVQVVDKRDGKLLLDTTTGRVLETVNLPITTTVFAATEAGIIETFDQRNRFLTAYAPVPETDWTVLYSLPLSQVYGSLTRLSAAVIGLVAIAAALALALSQFVAREVTDRLAAIQQAAGSLTAGKLDKRVHVEGDDELADLGQAFNDMADQIEAGQTELARVNTELHHAVGVRDDFLSVASHEMKTPLTPIKGFSQTLLRQLERTDRPFDREQAIKVLRMMNLQADRLADLVNDLLDTSRIRSGRFVLTPAPMDLVTLSREVAERFASQSESEGTIISVLAPSGDVRGSWDAGRLDQVITNLISNALRYSPEGGAVTVAVAANGDGAHLTVSDQGIGIPPDSLGNLFQPFYRASNAMHHYGGLGLGLYISREIVERHGGRIWAESAGPGQGSQFHVTLPREAAPTGETSIAAQGT